MDSIDKEEEDNKNIFISFKNLLKICLWNNYFNTDLLNLFFYITKKAIRSSGSEMEGPAFA